MIVCDTYARMRTNVVYTFKRHTQWLLRTKLFHFIQSETANETTLCVAFITPHGTSSNITPCNNCIQAACDVFTTSPHRFNTIRAPLFEQQNRTTESHDVHVVCNVRKSKRYRSAVTVCKSVFYFY